MITSIPGGKIKQAFPLGFHPVTFRSFSLQRVSPVTSLTARDMRETCTAQTLNLP